MTSLQGETFYVSPKGDDSHPGTQDAPLKTISAAAELAEAGDTILVLEGVYRERVSPPRSGNPGKPIIYRGEPGKRVIVKGSEVWRPKWNSEGNGVFSAHPDDSMFDDRSREYIDHYNPLKVALASTPWSREGKREFERGFGGDERLIYTCGQVFVDGKPFLEVPYREELKPDAWWYDGKKDRLFVDFGQRSPEECIVELTTRRRIFAPQRRGLGYIVVDGFIFEHCGNQYPTNFWEVPANAQRGAVGTEAGHHWVIRHNVIRYAKTFALDVGRINGTSDRDSSFDNLVESNYIIENGSAGIMSCGSRNLVIRKNVILRNNRLHFLGEKRWEQAGIKCHLLADGLIEGNYVAWNHDTYGVWLDNRFPDSEITGNVIHDNGRAGVFLEMSDYGFDRLVVQDNFVFCNDENAVYIHDASGATFINNLLANTRDTHGYGQAVYIRQVRPRTRTSHHSFFGNLLIGNARNIEVNYPGYRSGPQRFDYNVYDVDPTVRSFSINNKSDIPVPWTANEFQALFRQEFSEGGLSNAAWRERDRAALVFEEWKTFWQHHGELNDLHSCCVRGNSVEYDPTRHELSIVLTTDPPKTAPLPDGKTESRVLRLKRGMNKLVIWRHLPIIPEGELPPSGWTAE